jgi:membrane protease YdiL (CAAX protease family)
MSTFTDFLKRNSLVAGIVLMFLLTWPIDLANSGVMPFQVPFAVYILLGYGFVLASVIMTGLTLGKEAIIALLKRFLLWRVGWKWYPVAFLLIPVIDLLAVYLNSIVSQTPVDFSTVFAYKIFGPSANLILLIVPFFIFDALTNGEEIGWRGYVLPRLQAKYSALISTLILGVIWSFWHLPKFVTHWDTVSFVWFVVDTVAKAILLTWLYNNTRGSLLLVTLFHASFNTASVMLPMANTATGENLGAEIFAVLLTVFVAVVVIFITGPERLSRYEPKQVQEGGFAGYLSATDNKVSIEIEGKASVESFAQDINP